MEQIFGIVERITFQNPENGFTVAKLHMPRKKELTTIVGRLPPLNPGEKVRCTGAWKTNASHGLQFEVESCQVEAPTDLVGIRKYLSSGLIKGIGPTYATRITEKFGLKTLDVIEHSPEELLNVPGLGQKRIDKITECWKEQNTVRGIMLFLQKYGITPLYAAKIYRSYGQEATAKIEENPFNLARDIPGIGFKMADAIAEKMGYGKENPLRISSGVEFLLHELSQEGHVCYPKDPFLKAAEETLQVPSPMIEGAIESLEREKRIVKAPLEAQEALWLKRLYLAECGIAKEILRLSSSPSPLRAVDCGRALLWVEETLHIQLAPNQQEAVKTSLVEKLHIITGGPGTGKSTITKAILAITGKLTRKIICAAPTGRAAKRMSEITHRMAQTIHSLLQYDFKAGGFKRNRENPLDCDLIIIDEASMIDTHLMYHLLKALPDKTRVLFVGDIHQLPSVGPGNVLKEMIESERVPVSTLNKIFRQAAGSRIITNAHRINTGRLPDLRSEEKGDFFFVEKKEPEEVLHALCDLVSNRLPKAYGFDPIEEIQVLAPMKKGIIGTYNLNLSLQEKLNPPKGDPYFHAGVRFSVGDKVMQMRNNYTKEVYNGDIGRVVSVDREEEELVFSFDGKEVLYTSRELDEVTLAYATSIHKYQGSECKCVVIPVHTSHYVMLHRNLLYTGVTRGKKLVVLVGTVKAIAMAVASDDVKTRYTGLKQQLLFSALPIRQGAPGGSPLQAVHPNSPPESSPGSPLPSASRAAG